MSTRAKTKTTGAKLSKGLPDPKAIYDAARRRAMSICAFTGANSKLRKEMQRDNKPARTKVCPGKVHVCPYARKNKKTGKEGKVGNKRKGICRGKAKK